MTVTNLLDDFNAAVRSLSLALVERNAALADWSQLQTTGQPADSALGRVKRLDQLVAERTQVVRKLDEQLSQARSAQAAAQRQNLSSGQIEQDEEATHA